MWVREALCQAPGSWAPLWSSSGPVSPRGLGICRRTVACPASSPHMATVQAPRSLCPNAPKPHPGPGGIFPELGLLRGNRAARGQPRPVGTTVPEDVGSSGTHGLGCPQSARRVPHGVQWSRGDRRGGPDGRSRASSSPTSWQETLRVLSLKLVFQVPVKLYLSR